MTGNPVPRPVLTVSAVDKTFTMHLQGGQRLAVLNHLDLVVHHGECVVLGGTSGAGKSTILKMVYGNYSADSGRILLHRDSVDDVIDLAGADAREVLAARRDTMGYVSQFLRCVPRVPALDIVAEPLVERGVDLPSARDRAAQVLTRLSIPERLWSLPPATFSGVSSSASTSPGVSCPICRCCCSTNPRRPSTPATATSWWNSSPRNGHRASACSASSTTSRCATRSPTGSSTSRPSPPTRRFRRDAAGRPLRPARSGHGRRRR